MKKAQMFTVGVVAVIALAAPILSGQSRKNDDNSGNRRVDMVDDCDPADPAWAPVGCFQRDGDVTAAEFNAFLRSPLYDNTPPPGDGIGSFLVGHPSWRNDPSHLVIESGKSIDVRNVGGRPHTFTAVAEFGGGVVPPLNVGAQPAPECALSVRIEPGAGTTLTAGGEGLQRFQCCFHPWMRATVRVVSKDDN